MLSVYETINQTGALKVVVHRSVISVPTCGDWSYQENPLSDNDTNRNFACANDTNLARMLANPDDLIEGKVPGAPLAGPELQTILLYRSGEIEVESDSSSLSSLTGDQ